MSRRILIIHDRFQYRGGGERLVLDMAKILGADIATEYWTKETYDKSEVPGQLFVLDEGEPTALGVRYLRAQWNFWWKMRKIIKNYDTIIFSGNNCLAAAIRPLKGKKTLYYCHTPVRFVYDLFSLRRASEPKAWKRIVMYDLGKWLVRGLYRLGLSRMSTVVTNSKNVQERLKRFCNRDSSVIYPPIQINRFKWLGQGDYYLSSARLDGLKRVGDTVRAFQKMPEKKLIVTSGGEEEANVRALAMGYPNITVLGWVDNEKLAELVGNCIATVYIPVDEDFGMTPVEGMAAGKPCIGVADGGLKETVIPGKTGSLIPKNYLIDDLVLAVRELTSERALLMRNDCETWAPQFSKDRFGREIIDALKYRIAIDASRSSGGVQKTGVEVVSDALIVQLEKTKPPDVVLSYFTPALIPWLSPDHQIVIDRPKFWTIIGLSQAIRHDRPDALFVPVHTLPFFCPKTTVRVIHDVSFLREPAAYSLRERSYMRFDLWRAKRICAFVIVPTEAVKNDLVNLLGWNPERIVVTGWGVNPVSVVPVQDKDAMNRVPTVLYIGRIEDKKNIANLIRAFELFHQYHLTWELVLAGKPGFGFSTIEPLLKTPGVRYVGYVSDEEKTRLLSTASILALVSKEEGFAFPMLEAFQYGVPVLASSIPTLKEVGQDAAVYAAPTDIDGLAKRIGELADDSELRGRLVEKGTKRLGEYSWEKVGEKVWGSLR